MFNDEYWMQYAIKLAKEAEKNNEVPVGAVLVYNQKIVGQGFNSPIQLSDPSAHAEILALRDYAAKIKNYRLMDTTLYVTLEPCMMCANAMVHARIKRLVFGAYDKKTGAVQSVAHALDLSFLNHKVQFQGGVLAEECGMLLKAFFSERR